MNVSKNLFKATVATPTHKVQQTVVISYITATEFNGKVVHYNDIFCNTLT